MVPRLVVALLLVTAGCTAADVGTSTERPTAATAPSTATSTPDTPTEPRSPPPTTTTATTATGPTATNTVAYDALSATQQRAFDRAREGRAQFVDESALESPYVGDGYFARDVAEPFRTHDYVRKEGRHYRVAYEESGGYGLATYGIRATEERPPEDAAVVALANLSTEIREPVRWAVENGSYGVPAGKWSSLPPAFDRFEYVRDGGDAYRISVVYGDLAADELRVEPVDT